MEHYFFGQKNNVIQGNHLNYDIIARISAVFASKILMASCIQFSKLDDICNTYGSLDLIKNKVVLWNESDYKYYVVSGSTNKEMESEMFKIGTSLHEVIFGKQYQRIKFDIDCTFSENIDTPIPSENNDLDSWLENSSYSVTIEKKKFTDNLLELLIEIIIDELCLQFWESDEVTISRDDILVTESNGSNKFSYHVIILNYMVANNDEAIKFHHSVIARMNEEQRTCIDSSVNKRRQNFRFLGCHKHGSDRVKKLCKNFSTYSKNISTLDARIAPSDETIKKFNINLLSAKIISNEDTMTELSTENQLILDALKCIENNYPDIEINFKLRKIYGSLLCYNRIKATFCRFCNEIHHKDHTLMYRINSIDDWPGNYEIYEHCRHKKGKSQLIGEFQSEMIVSFRTHTTMRSDQKTKENIIDKTIGRLLANSTSTNGKIVANENSDDLFALITSNYVTYNEPQMRPYELVPSLIIKAQMGLGKTITLKKYIESYHSNNLDKSVIRFVTFRQTFSNSLLKSFPDFVLYSDIQGDISHIQYPRIIVQVESLHRLKMIPNIEPIDLLILDESESIINQFGSGLHKRFNLSFAIFSWMMKTAKHVIMMDANISQRSINVMKTLRENHPINLCVNLWQSAAKDSYYFTNNKEKFLEQISNYILNDKRIAIASNSLTDAKTLYDLCKDIKPNISIQLYTSETLQSIKSEHFQNVDKYWTKYDVVIYTPTCSAGVSFEMKYFDAMFGYFCDASCDVETCRQMLGRVRSLNENKYLIYLWGQGNTLPTEIQDIKKYLTLSRRQLFDDNSDFTLQFTYDDVGNIQYYESDYFKLWLENERIKNLSRNQFVSRFITQVYESGASINTLSALTVNNTNDKNIMSLFKTIKGEIKWNACEMIASSPEITSDEVTTFQELCEQKKDTTIAQRASYDKFQLRKYYKWKEPVTGLFVEAYWNSAARNVYKNIRQIAPHKSINDALSYIRDNEKTNFEYTVLYLHNETIDLLSNYSFSAHNYALWLLRVCDFDFIVDKNYIHFMHLYIRLDTVFYKFSVCYDHIASEFKLKKINLDRIKSLEPQKFVDKFLSIINSILRIQYGIEVKKDLSSKVWYYLKSSDVGSLFVLEHDIVSPIKCVKIKCNNSDYLRNVKLTCQDVIASVFITQVYYDLNMHQNE